jgi:hypothetical protein
MIVTNSSAFVPEVPTIDVSEARWASEELASIIERLPPDSPTGLVLRQACRELASLAQSGSPGTVVGPFRIAA